MSPVGTISMASRCLTESEILCHLDDNATVEQEGHLEICEQCQDRIGSLLGDLHSLRSQYKKPVKNEKVARAAMDVTTKSRIGKYELLERISSGGQGTVYRARDPDLERIVGIKLETRSLSDSENEYSQIHQEGLILAKIRHPNLAQIHDYGVHDSHPYLVMDYIEGLTLQQSMTTREFTDQEIRSIMIQLTSVLQLCHNEKILHLDIKPENIIVDNQLHLKLIDFGVSLQRPQALDLGHIVAGTLEFMSPEQLSGDTHNWSERTDIYGLGALLLCLLTGYTPNVSAVSNEEHDAWIQDKLNHVSCSSSIKKACLKALSIRPQDRFRNATEFQRAIVGDTRPVGAMLILMGAVLIACGLYHWTSVGTELARKIEKVPTTASVNEWSPQD